MKGGFLIVFLLFSLFLKAKDFEREYKKILGIEYGIFAALNSDKYGNLTGNRIDFSASYYFSDRWGISSGINLITNIQGSNSYYSVPLYVKFKTPVYKPSEIYIDAETLMELFIELILGIMPRQYEFNFGTSLGYIDPVNSLPLISINGGPVHEEGYSVSQRFASSIDLGFTGKYKIRQFGIVISPNLSYMLTKNFEYSSELNLNKDYKPSIFLSLTIGFSYEF